MTTSIDSNLLLKEAYQKLKTDLSDPKYQHIEPSATRFLEELQQEIRKWNDTSSISKFNKYWTAPEANDVSAEGIAKMNRSNFTDVFLKDDITKNMIKLLLLLRLKEPMDFRIIGKIADVGLIEHINNVSFLEGNKPIFYVHRLLIMIFPDIFTSISDRGKLDKTAKELGIRSEKVAFERVQYQLRDKVDTFIQKEGLESESDFVKRGIAWWVNDAAKNLKTKNV